MYEEIWLQCPNLDEESEWCGEVTWCQDKVNDDDTKYVRADLLDEALTQLAAAQVRILELREALDELARLGNGDSYGNSIGNCIAQKALAIPTDDTALRKLVAKHVRTIGERHGIEDIENYANNIRKGSVPL